MASPMIDLPDHIPMGVDEYGDGPVGADESVRTICWSCLDDWPCAGYSEEAGMKYKRNLDSDEGKMWLDYYRKDVAHGESVVESVAKAIRDRGDIRRGCDNEAANRAIAAVRAADREAGMVLVSREDVESIRPSWSIRPDECHCYVCSEHNAGLKGLRAALEAS